MIVLAITLLLIAVILALYAMLRVGAMVDKEKEKQNGHRQHEKTTQRSVRQGAKGKSK